MDNLTVFNIAKFADQKTVVAILHAGGPKFFKEARDISIIGDVELGNDTYFQTRFVVNERDFPKERSFVDHIARVFKIYMRGYAMQTWNPIVRRNQMMEFMSAAKMTSSSVMYDMGKSYTMAANEMGNEFIIISNQKKDFQVGLELLKEYARDGKIVFTSDLIIHIPEKCIPKFQKYKLPSVRLFDDGVPYLVTGIDKFGRCSVVQKL